MKHSSHFNGKFCRLLVSALLVLFSVPGLSAEDPSAEQRRLISYIDGLRGADISAQVQRCGLEGYSDVSVLEELLVKRIGQPLAPEDHSALSDEILESLERAVESPFNSAPRQTVETLIYAGRRDGAIRALQAIAELQSARGNHDLRDTLAYGALAASAREVEQRLLRREGDVSGLSRAYQNLERAKAAFRRAPVPK